jgi:hypothetical protein
MLYFIFFCMKLKEWRLRRREDEKLHLELL